MLRKNLLLQTRSSRALAGAGWAGLALEVLTPAAFFLLMCLPKFYLDVQPQPLPTQLFRAVDLDQPDWANRYGGMPNETLSSLASGFTLHATLHEASSPRGAGAISCVRSGTCLPACPCAEASCMTVPVCMHERGSMKMARRSPCCRPGGLARLPGAGALRAQRQRRRVGGHGQRRARRGLPGGARPGGGRFQELLRALPRHQRGHPGGGVRGAGAVCGDGRLLAAAARGP